MENCLTKLEKEEQGKEKDDIIDELNKELFRIDVTVKNMQYTNF